MDLPSALRDWQELLGTSAVLAGTLAEVVYGADASGSERFIPAALQIADATALPAVMRIASRYNVPVYPISTGKNWGYGTALPARDCCAIIDLSRLQRIVDFDAQLGVVTLEPGVTQGMLAAFLEAGNHPYLVPVTGAGPTCSVLGNALERGYGVTPLVDHFSAITDIEAVLADGTLYRTAMREAGGQDLARLFKWGIGPYSAGLFTQGGFGVVTSASIVLARRPESVKACLFGLQSEDLLEVAVDRIRSILTKLPGTVGAINLMNRRRVLSMTTPFPERLGADGMVPANVIAELGKRYQVQPWTGFATLYGPDRMVAAAQKEIKAELRGVASRMLFVTPGRAVSLTNFANRIPGDLGRRLSSLAATLATSLELVAGRPNETALPLAYWRNQRQALAGPRDPSRDGCGLLWYAPLVPMRAKGVRAYVSMVEQIAPKYGIEPLITLTSLNDRLFDSTVPLIFERGDAVAVSSARACYKELLETGRRQGWFPYRVGIDSMATLMSYQADAKVFHERLRRDLDPQDILSPGRYR